MLCCWAWASLVVMSPFWYFSCSWAASYWRFCSFCAQLFWAFSVLACRAAPSVRKRSLCASTASTCTYATSPQPVASVVAAGVAAVVSAPLFESQAVSERAAMHAVSKMFFISSLIF